MELVFKFAQLAIVLPAKAKQLAQPALKVIKLVLFKLNANLIAVLTIASTAIVLPIAKLAMKDINSEIILAYQNVLRENIWVILPVLTAQPTVSPAKHQKPVQFVISAHHFITLIVILLANLALE